MTPYSNNIKPNAAKAKKTIRKRRPRRALPEDLTNFYVGDRPTNLDVIAGRGGGSNNHEGNKRYWLRILAERPGYKQLGTNDNAEKNGIARAIYEYILSTRGRFLQLDSKTQKWFSTPEKISLDKIKQALRDKYVPHFAKGESQSQNTTPLPAPLVITEGDKNQFLGFLNKKPTGNFFKTPSFEFLNYNTAKDVFNAPSLDLASILGQVSVGKLDTPKVFPQHALSSQDFPPFPESSKITNDYWSKFSTQNKNTMRSLEFNLRGHSLDHLMRGDLIKTVDNMAETSTLEAPKSLQALLQQQMESAIPSSRSTFVEV